MSEKENKFKVTCKKSTKKRNRYDIDFLFNREFVEHIKLLPTKERTFQKVNNNWELTTKGLYTLIKFFKGSDKIHFSFEDDQIKRDFIEKIRKIDIEEAEYRRRVQKNEENKKLWIKLKDDYEKNYHDHWERTHINLKEGVKLYSYQVVAALFLNETKSALLSLDMGLGKTLSSICYVEMNEMKKVFVITPNSLKFNFYDEIEKFTNSKAHIVNWKKNKYSIEESKYIITNYEFFNKGDKKAMDRKFTSLGISKIDCLICDESHRLKNDSSNTYKNFKRIFNEKIFANGIISKVFLSGTPAPNRAYELYTILNQISTIDFATKTHFYEYYCGMTYDPYGFGWETNIDNQRLEELYHKISPFTYRKRKKDVLDLPDKTYQNVMLELTNEEELEYNKIEEETFDELYGIQVEKNPLTIMVRLRQFTANAKVSRVKEIIDSVIEEGQKLVIVDYYKDSLYEIYKLYPNISAIHTGDQTPEERADIVRKFQNPKSDLKIFLGSIQTCNYGLTLTAADKLIIITQPYSVGENDQVSDRLHRIGQKYNVHIFYLLFRETIDEYVYSSIESKRKEISKVMDNEEYSSTAVESVVGDVIKMIMKKHGR